MNGITSRERDGEGFKAVEKADFGRRSRERPMALSEGKESDE